MRLSSPFDTTRSEPAHADAASGGVFAPRGHDPTRQTMTTQPGASSGVSPVDSNLIGRTSIGLMVVIGLILVSGYLLKRIGPYRSQNSKSLSVVASQSVGYRERIVIVDVADQRLVLGVTASNVNKLHELAAPPPEDRPATPNQPPSFGQAFAETLRQARQRFNARSRS